jgi:protein kinase A/protein kinase X
MQMSNSEFFLDVRHKLENLKKQEIQGLDIYARERFYDSSFYESEVDSEFEKTLQAQGLGKRALQPQPATKAPPKKKPTFKELRIGDFEIHTTLGNRDVP